MRWLLIASPDHPRTRAFVGALRAHAQPCVQVVSWLQAIEQPGLLNRLADVPTLVRIDAWGQTPHVEAALLRRGYAAARACGVAAVSPQALQAQLPLARGRVLCPRQQHLGSLRVLAELHTALRAKSTWRVLSPPHSIAALFDKRLAQARYAALGIPVPPILGPVAHFEQLRAEVAAAGWEAAWVKLSCGSSAACLAYYSRARGHERVVTTLEMTPQGAYNTRRLRHLSSPQRMAQVIDFLAREGAHVERDVPKARLQGRLFDCRVLMIAGQPAFVLPRLSPHPITNLHLGAVRGCPDQLRQQVPPEAWAAAMQSCRRVFAAHDAFHLGIDLLFEPGLRRHRIIEANAFGDWLPNLQRAGCSAHDWQVRAALGLPLPPSCATAGLARAPGGQSRTPGPD